MVIAQVMNNLLEMIPVISVVGRSENSDDDYEPTSKHQKWTVASTSRSSKSTLTLV